MRDVGAAAILISLAWTAAVGAQTIRFDREQLLVVASASPDVSFVGGVDNASLTIDQDSNDYGGDGVSHALLRFLDFRIPVGATVRRASLSFFTTSATNGPVDVFRTTADWSLQTTWNALGGDGLTPGVELTAEPAASQIEIVEGKEVSFDVTPIVVDWSNGAANHGFGIVNQSGDGWDVRTIDVVQDAQFAPRLFVEFENPPPARLQINPANGYARLVSQLAEIPFELRGYDLQSAEGRLAPEAWKLGNLSARGLGAVDPTLPAGRWSVVNDAADQLFEAFYLGGAALEPGEALVLGQVIDPLPPGGSLPILRLDLVATNYLGGADALVSFTNVPVEFVAFELPAVDGDFNADGRVDGADLLFWQRSDGSSEGLAAWAANFGRANVQASGLSVPEPHALACGMLAVGAVLPGVRRKRA